MARRKVANTPLARAINDLIERYGSDDKLAAVIDGATRFTVIRWRLGTIPEKPEYVEALRHLGVPAKLLEEAQATLTRQDQLRLAALEEEVSLLRREFDAFVEAATERQVGQEEAPAPARRRSTPRSKGRADQ